MKIIFLDVDGVLNSASDIDDIADRPLLLLKKLMDQTGAKIVVSSSWRISKHLFAKLKNTLRQYNIEIKDVTPCIRKLDFQRGDEIKMWLKAHNTHNEIESFVILDDEADMGEFRETNLVQTTYEKGLQIEHIEKALKILNGKL